MIINDYIYRITDIDTLAAAAYKILYTALCSNVNNYYYVLIIIIIFIVIIMFKI